MAGCFFFANPSGFLFGPSQKGTICSSDSSELFPQVGCVVLRLVGFGVFIVVGFNLTEAQVGNITVKVTHNGCVSRMRVWVKLQDGTSGWHQSAELQQQFHFTSYLT
jgi:hypothetical protein